MIQSFCGAIVGVTHFVIGQPFDFLKVKYQTNQLTHQNTLSKSNINITNNTSNLKKYYSGGLSMMLGLPLATAIQFSVYEYIKGEKFCSKIIHKDNNVKQRQQFLDISAGALLAGTLSSLILNITQYLKIQKQIAILHPIKYQKIQDKKNFQNILASLSTTCMRDAIGSLILFNTYQIVVGQLCQRKKMKRQFAEFRDFVIGGAVAGFAQSALMYSIDENKTRLQAHQSLGNRQFQDRIKGFKFAVARGTIVNACSFALYEQFKGFGQMVKYFSQS